MPISQSTDDIPVKALELDVPLQISSSKSLFSNYLMILFIKNPFI